MKKRGLVEIVWSDASFNEASGMMEYPDFLLERYLKETHTYGLLVREDDKCVVIQHHATLGGDRKFSVIPKVLITGKIEYFQKEKKSKKK